MLFRQVDFSACLNYSPKIIEKLFVPPMSNKDKGIKKMIEERNQAAKNETAFCRRNLDF